MPEEPPKNGMKRVKVPPEVDPKSEDERPGRPDASFTQIRVTLPLVDRATYVCWTYAPSKLERRS